MKDKNKFLLASMSVGLLGLVFASSTSALTYQEEIPVSFTFNRGLSLSVSASDLHIYNLVPGNSDESNIITVTTTSNNVTGYVLTASVGNSTKNTTNLVNGSNNFASIATNASQSSLTTDNTWGYSISTNNGSSWSNYSGLPIFSSTTWKEIASTNANGTTSILFKIGAKASSSQAAGDYTNVINFTATTNYVPMSNISELTYMQDFDSLNSTDKTSVLNSMVQNSQYTLKDSRDQQNYTITKLSDGNVWMTKNLRLDISQHGDRITSNNTNNPTSAFLNAVSTNPTSATPCSAQSINCTDQIAYDASNIGNTTIDPDGHTYDEYGVYYNYYTSTSGHGTYSYGGIAEGDLCPAGWHLPGSGSSSEFASLNSVLNSGSKTSDAGLLTQPANFVHSGYRIVNGFTDLGTMGRYWTSQSQSTGSWAYVFGFRSSYVGYGDGDYSFQYLTVRCVLK